MKNFLLLLFVLLFCGACTAQKATKPAAMTAPILIYKTKQDYHNLVPVMLSEDKTEIVSYPAPSDVYYQGKLAVPTRLKKGYLLDNRGIGLQVAFLKLTYRKYAKLKAAPPLAEMYKMVLDKDPLSELYHCGPRLNADNIVSKFNNIIVQGKLTDYVKLK